MKYDTNDRYFILNGEIKEAHCPEQRSKSMESKEITEIVMKLIGEIEPCGIHQVDVKRLENLKTLTALVDDIIYKIEQVAESANRPEMSMSIIGLYAKNFLNEIKEEK